MYRDGALLVGLPLVSILVVSWGITSSLRGSLILVGVLGSLLLHLLGAMLLAGVNSVGWRGGTWTSESWFWRSMGDLNLSPDRQ